MTGNSELVLVWTRSCLSPLALDEVACGKTDFTKF